MLNRKNESLEQKAPSRRKVLTAGNRCGSRDVQSAQISENINVFLLAVTASEAAEAACR
jgi:hypothetical protein